MWKLSVHVFKTCYEEFQKQFMFVFSPPLWGLFWGEKGSKMSASPYQQPSICKLMKPHLNPFIITWSFVTQKGPGFMDKTSQKFIVIRYDILLSKLIFWYFKQNCGLLFFLFILFSWNSSIQHFYFYIT